MGYHLESPNLEGPFGQPKVTSAAASHQVSLALGRTIGGGGGGFGGDGQGGSIIRAVVGRGGGSTSSRAVAGGGGAAEGLGHGARGAVLLEDAAVDDALVDARGLETALGDVAAPADGLLEQAKVVLALAADIVGHGLGDLGEGVGAG